ncbi:MAG: cytochrome c oxidase subunit II [Alphaproteobacteria bacterium]|nr:MAG: cytochrome c oxidase subunit II [Alphaproteobacteria bacterium]
MNKTLRPLATLMATLAAGAAHAQELEVIGRPRSGLMGLQPAATDIARATHMLDNMLLWIIAGVVALVALLMLWVIVRYNRFANKEPRRFSHYTPVEIIWTLGPVLILVFIGANSLPVLFKQEEIPAGDVVIKATGNQWYWSYEYPDEGFGFDAFLLQKDELADHGYSPDLYLLATDNAVVVPTGKKIVVQVTGADVIHSWTVPAFGVKQDAVPGRLAELWFTVDPGMEGIYFGQCSELCGKDHAYMPITVKAVTPEDYEKWLAKAREEFAGTPSTITVASAE